MLLAINANNTNTGFSVWEGDRRRGAWRVSTDARRTADEYVVWLDHLLSLEGIERAQLTGTIIASVVPEANFNLRRLCRHYCGSEPLMVGEPGVELGTRAIVDRPEEVGADRLCNTVGAYDRYPAPLVVVDFGTTTNFDVVDGDGNYRGGIIAPGINLSNQALHLAAAKLPSVPIQRPAKVIGTTTVACMQSGVFWGYVALIEGLVERAKEEWGGPMGVVATGGLAPLFEGATPVLDRVDPDLTLWGLRLIYARNTAR